MMGQILVLLCISLLIIFSLILEKNKLTPFFITLLSTIQILLGYYYLDLLSLNNSSWMIYLGNIIIFMLGYFSFRFILGTNMKLNIEEIGNDLTKTGFNVKDHTTHIIFVTIIIMFTMYHFIVGGIPILSNSIEVDRFAFSSSGLFGIPGRIFLFGLPFILIYVSYYDKQINNSYSKKLKIIVWIAFILFKLLSGFKGAILDIIILFVFIKAFLNQPLKVKNIFTFRSVLLLFSGVIFAAFISSFYSSLSLNGLEDIFKYLLARLTQIAAEASYYVINNLHFFESPYSYQYNDFAYFINKYFHIQMIGDREVFPIDKIVSSMLNNTPLSEYNFIVPVTVGAFAGLVLDFGIIGGYFGMFLIGSIYYYLFINCLKAKSPFKGASLGIILYQFHVYILNGGLVYTLINTSVIILFLFMLKILSQIIAHIIIGAARKS